MRYSIISIFLLLSAALRAQNNPFGGFNSVYPLGENSTISFMSSFTPQETVLFEAHPIVRYSFYNNMVERLFDGKNSAMALYAGVRPHWRMYTDSSLPVKTPSFKAGLGGQYLMRVKDKNLFTIALESGHFSNGQPDCAFDPKYRDGSPGCDSIYALITDDTDLSKILNRESGNFSTDYTDLLFNYRINRLDDNFAPDRTHSLTLGFTLYHDYFWGFLPFGGYSDADIKIYGKIRYHIGYEYIHVLGNKFLFMKSGTRFTLSENIEWIQDPHPSVNPFRSVSTLAIYPHIRSKGFGYFVSFISGHDNYNYRFVDSGSRINGGITFNFFPPFQIKSALGL